MFLYNLIIAPIEVVIDYVFTLFSCKFFHLGPFVALYAVSIFVNYLTLPLYNYADKIQERERAIVKKLEPLVKHIKNTFKGNEQFLMLKEMYRQNNYHPLYALRSSLSILIEIPFFIAAYHYLSNATYLNTAVFWKFTNLGLPDYLYHIIIFGKSVPINVLPIAMTVINFISAAIYTKGYPKRDKIQTYVIGLLFLVLLYNAPSGLVMYWICNNLFSLFKNIALKTHFAREICIASVGLNIFVFGMLTKTFPETGILSPHPQIIMCLGVLVVVLSFFIRFISKTKFVLNIKKNISSFNTYIFKDYKKDSLLLLLSSGLGLALLSGFLLPSNVIATSPVEFSFIGNTASPVNYIRRSIAVGLGLFLLWPFVISKITETKQKFRGGVVFATMFVLSIFDAFLLKSNYGNLDATFFLDFPENLKDVSAVQVIMPIIIIIFTVGIVLTLIKFKKSRIISIVFVSIALAEFIIACTKVSYIKKQFNEHVATSSTAKKEESNILRPIYHLTKDGKNVVVLFFDRAQSDFFPYALEWHPELKEQFKGFTFYPNTLSQQGSTIGGSPSMLGGYEYMMQAINERDDESLVSKHNEAILTAPVLFKNAGYNVAVTDPPWLNYTYYGDLRPFDIKEAEGIYVEQLDQTYYGRPIRQFLKDHTEFTSKDMDKATYKETINFSILQMLPPLLRYGFNSYLRNPNMDVQMAKIKFIAPFSGVYYLNSLTDFTSDKNSYMFIGNNTTHEPTYLDETLTLPVDKENTVKTNLTTDSTFTIISYQAFVAVLKQVGNWLDYLRENGVYDNTRIVIVADHGGSMDLPGLDNWDIPLNIRRLSPLLLFKDFDQNGEIRTDDTFMTNADTIFLAKQNLDEVSNKNPFTGKEFIQDKQNGVNVYPPSFALSTVALKSPKYHKFDMDENEMWHFEGKETRLSSNWTPYLIWKNSSMDY